MSDAYDGALSTGENLFSTQDVENLVRFGGLKAARGDIIQVDPPQAYGIVQYARTLDMLARHGWPRSGLFPHGGNQMSLHIAGGFGLGGAESYPGVFGAFAGFADDARLEDGYLKLPDRPGIGFEGQAALYKHHARARRVARFAEACYGSRRMADESSRRPGRSCSAQEQPLLLPCAHDALSARLIERAGFTGLFDRRLRAGRLALRASPTSGSRPSPRSAPASATSWRRRELPVLVDGDTGYGDVKNVAHTIEGYEAMGASAIFIEDQVAPKRCGHMAGKDVIAGRGDGGEDQGRGRRATQQGLLHHRAHRRARRAWPRRGAAPRRACISTPAPTAFSSRRRRPCRSWSGSAARSRACRRSPTCWRAAARRRCCRRHELKAMGFAMAAYPTTLIFRVARTIERALADIKAGKPLAGNDGVDFAGFKDITNFNEWARIEDTYGRARGTA